MSGLHPQGGALVKKCNECIYLVLALKKEPGVYLILFAYLNENPA